MNSANQKDIDILALIIDVKLMIENSTVFQSQVGEQLIALQALGYKTGLLAVSKDVSIFERVIGEKLRASGIVIFLIQDLGFIKNLPSMASALRKIRSERQINHVYVRGLWGPIVLALANPLRRLKYVYDVRGAIGDEAKAAGTGKVKRSVYLALEAWGIRGASAVTAVTYFLAEATAHRTNKAKVHVVPCNVNVDDFGVTNEVAQKKRQEVGFSLTDIVLVYSGGLSHYQQVPAMLALWRRLLDEPDVKFMLLTNDDPHAKPLIVGSLSEFGSRLCCHSLPRNEVASALASASIGFMLRDSRELNNAASPVKFGEYVASGLAVVASPGTGDVSRYIEEHRIGVLVDPLSLEQGEIRVRELIRCIRLEPESFRVRSRRLAETRYDWKAYQSVYHEIYNTVN